MLKPSFWLLKPSFPIVSQSFPTHYPSVSVRLPIGSRTAKSVSIPITTAFTRTRPCEFPTIGKQTNQWNLNNSTSVCTCVINSYYYYYNIFFVKKHHYMVEKWYCFWYYHVLSTFVTVAILYVFNVCLSNKHSKTNCVFEWTKLTRKVLVNMAHFQLNGSLLKLVSKYI